jgi:hypothetical protein
MPRHHQVSRATAKGARRVLIAFAIVSFFLTAATAQADEEAANKPHFVTGIVMGDLHNGCYAKSVPDAAWGVKGTTKVYAVRKGKDRLIATFPWYARKLHLQCRRGPDGAMRAAIVRLGPWQRGQRASKDHLAIAFYKGSRELARYSTLDLAGRADNVRPSVSHYRIIREVKGFVEPNHFRLALLDGRTLTFDLTTGKLRRGN